MFGDSGQKKLPTQLNRAGSSKGSRRSLRPNVSIRNQILEIEQKNVSDKSKFVRGSNNGGSVRAPSAVAPAPAPAAPSAAGDPDAQLVRQMQSDLSRHRASELHELVQVARTKYNVFLQFTDDHFDLQSFLAWKQSDNNYWGHGLVFAILVAFSSSLYEAHNTVGQPLCTAALAFTVLSTVAFALSSASSAYLDVSGDATGVYRQLRVAAKHVYAYIRYRALSAHRQLSTATRSPAHTSFRHPSPLTCPSPHPPPLSLTCPSPHPPPLTPPGHCRTPCWWRAR